MPFFLNLYFQAPKHPLVHVSMQIRTKPRTPSLMALPIVLLYYIFTIDLKGLDYVFKHFEQIFFHIYVYSNMP